MPVLQQAVALSIEEVLLATDFSVASEKAGAYAKALVRRFGSNLEIAHVFDPSVVTSYEEAIVPMTATDRKQIADENLQCFARNLALDEIPTRLVSTEDHDVSSALLELATDQHADLIVTGTESKTGLSRLILGSTAEQLLRRASCPVLAVGPKAREPKAGALMFKTILYATDFSPEAMKAATYAFTFAQESGATLLCCCVVEEGDERSSTTASAAEVGERLKRLIPKDAHEWCNPEVFVEYGNAANEILQLAEEHDVDLIVLGARRASFWLNRVHGGLTPQLLAEAKCPVLTIS